jgi:hypothetical protein
MVKVRLPLQAYFQSRPVAVGFQAETNPIIPSAEQFEKQSLPCFAFIELVADGGVIVSAILDRVIENRRVGRQPGNGQFVDIALKQAAVQEVPRNIVEPQALAQVVEFLGRFHRVISRELHCRASVAGGLGFGHRFLLS